MSDDSSELPKYDDEYDRLALPGVLLLIPPALERPLRDGDVELYGLESLCESPSSEFDAVPLYDSVDVTIAVPEPDVRPMVSSVTSPVVVLSSVLPSARVNDDEE